jgi:signal transduction histidine kinase
MQTSQETINRVAGPRARRDGAIPPKQSRRILIVEDDPSVRGLLEALLGGMWQVSSVGNGEEALMALQDQLPDLILSDVFMPRMDGVSLVRALRAEPRTASIPVILLSGRAGEGETIGGLEAGADDFLVKPFSTRELLVRVQSRMEITAMRRRNAQQEAALDALERHRLWTEHLLDSMPVPLLLLLPGTDRVVFGNRAASRLAGSDIPPNVTLEQLGITCRVDGPNGRPLRPADLSPRTEEHPLRDLRIVWDAPGGRAFLLADSELLPATEDHPSLVTLTLRDVTALVQTERQLRDSLHARDDFLVAVSHELRTPLTTLELQTTDLARALTRNVASREQERLARKAEIIRKQTDSLSYLVQKMLEVSREAEAEHGLTLRRESVDLGELTQHVVESLREQAAQAGCSLETTTTPGLTGNWDLARVEQLVANLLSNAIKFGAGHPIVVRVDGDDRVARLTIQDRGIGISPEAHERIFQRFERASPLTHYPGLGLGLWMVRRIVDALDGTITVDSRPGEGATFIVELPRG